MTRTEGHGPKVPRFDASAGAGVLPDMVRVDRPLAGRTAHGAGKSTDPGKVLRVAPRIRLIVHHHPRPAGCDPFGPLRLSTLGTLDAQMLRGEPGGARRPTAAAALCEREHHPPKLPARMMSSIALDPSQAQSRAATSIGEEKLVGVGTKPASRTFSTIISSSSQN